SGTTGLSQPDDAGFVGSPSMRVDGEMWGRDREEGSLMIGRDGWRMVYFGLQGHGFQLLSGVGRGSLSPWPVRYGPGSMVLDRPRAPRPDLRVGQPAHPAPGRAHRRPLVRRLQLREPVLAAEASSQACLQGSPRRGRRGGGGAGRRFVRRPG